MNKKIAVIGDGDSVKGFAAIGFDTFPFAEPESAGRTLRTLAEGDLYGVIYLTEPFYRALSKEIERYSTRLLPAILPIPAAGSGAEIGTSRLSSFVEKAVGSDIIFKQ